MCPSSLQERNDVEVEKVKSTLILCYGQVALNAPPEKILNRIDQDILRCISKHFNTKVMSMLENNDFFFKTSKLHTEKNALISRGKNAFWSEAAGLIDMQIYDC